MIITFKNKHLRILCNSKKAITSQVGPELANLLRRRLDDLASAPHLGILKSPFPGKCRVHKLGPPPVFILNFGETGRLHFIPVDKIVLDKKDNFDWSVVKSIQILEVMND